MNDITKNALPVETEFGLRDLFEFLSKEYLNYCNFTREHYERTKTVETKYVTIIGLIRTIRIKLLTSDDTAMVERTHLLLDIERDLHAIHSNLLPVNEHVKVSSLDPNYYLHAPEVFTFGPGF